MSIRWGRVILVALALMVGACFPGPLELDEDDVADVVDTGSSSSDVDAAAPDGLDVVDTDGADPDVTVPEDGDTSGVDATETADATADTAETTDTVEPVDTADTIEVDTRSVDGGEVGDDVVELNVCGGVGTVGPGQPGDPCGPCGDGAWACDPEDASGRTTRCEDARPVDVCGGCGLANPLGDACGDCGSYGCDPNGSEVVCLEPEGGCPIILECEDLTCEAAGRLCIESDGEADAMCGACLATHVLVEGSCLPRVVAPATVTASTDRSADVELTWSIGGNATGYRVYRCDVVDCTPAAAWSELTSSPVTERTFVDATAAAPGTPGAPATVNATRDRTDRIDVTWAAVSAPAAPRYRYRVTTIGAAGESDPSTSAEGARAERPVTGYELQVDDGAWVAVAGGLVTSWADTNAAAATLNAGTASASFGTFAEYVRLSVSGVAASAGASKSYRVRAVTAYGPAAASSSTSGWRVAGALTYAWERSADSEPEGFAALVGATGTTFDDTGAPADGSTRWYRVVVSATGATAATSAAVAGARQGPPDVPAGVSASRDLEDRVTIEWRAVSGAIGYHVYRDGTKLTTGNGVTTTTYSDFGAAAPTTAWAAPTSVSATTNNTAQVTVQWTAPSRPLGETYKYTVSAVNAAAEGPISAHSTGQRAALALVGFDVEIAPTGGNTTWVSTGSTATTFVHATAPAGTITGGTITATQGMHKDEVRLVSTGASASAGANVVYKVRGVLQGGTTYTPTSGSATGRRSVGALTRQWQRSSGTSASDYANISGAVSSTNNDNGAPVDGSKRWYQLVLNATGAPSVTVGPTEGWRLAFERVTTGWTHTCAITRDGQVWCWGNNYSGQLGLGTAETTERPPTLVSSIAAHRIVEVTAGGEHTCARTESGGVWCWGKNASGQIGDGTNTDRWSPVPTSIVGAVSISAGYRHVCAALSGGTVSCWGLNTNGQLGDDSTANRSTPVTVKTGPSTNLTGATQVASGESHTCARRSTAVSCWGAGSEGQLGGGLSGPVYDTAWAVPDLPAVADLSVGHSHSCVVLTTGAARCWGMNSNGQLGNGITATQSSTPVSVSVISSAVSVAGLAASTCARTTSSTLYCWGADSTGQLGNGSGGVDSNVPVLVTALANSSDLRAGSYANHVCAIVDHDVWCWGANAAGALGDGTTTNRFSPTRVSLP